MAGFAIYEVEGKEPKMSTIFEAAEFGNCDLIKSIMRGRNMNVDGKDRFGRTALMWACDAGQRDAVDLLLRLGSNTELLDSKMERTAMHWAARSANIDVVESLVKCDAEVNVKDKSGLTPLFIAIQKGEVAKPVVNFLLKNGAKYQEIHYEKLLPDATAEMLASIGDPEIPKTEAAGEEESEDFVDGSESVQNISET
mmetsp:Transcript_36130/g.50163  ORF Transcript_36130/g.50163 Transcript_36130/m.50163 type:complete len:197 (+) Transcript_36130:70-660(+)|eukprot:CAMPEP_0196589974 /NCGR_PEP_ID=MMETSP1081-20130531/65151_1 /TAXON_ID=36882 /ORGANISM="Pyramimonas amylifera, Strain CCMP720" /LENGTH=196 /DNA_ID=CAMNT_0041912925 /DNA_START=41 /DNA_END=631 /DNA_ORIENTATION=+